MPSEWDLTGIWRWPWRSPRRSASSGRCARKAPACAPTLVGLGSALVDREGGPDHPGAVSLSLEIRGGGSVAALAGELDDLDGVLSAAGDFNEFLD